MEHRQSDNFLEIFVPIVFDVKLIYIKLFPSAEPTRCIILAARRGVLWRRRRRRRRHVKASTNTPPTISSILRVFIHHSRDRCILRCELVGVVWFPETPSCRTDEALVWQGTDERKCVLVYSDTSGRRCSRVCTATDFVIPALLPMIWWEKYS